MFTFEGGWGPGDEPEDYWSGDWVWEQITNTGSLKVFHKKLEK